MPVFSGTLNTNEVVASLYNMIISQEVFADNIADGYGSLVERARVDGGLYGDQKLFIATDALRSYDWLGDAEAPNLLAVDRPPLPYEQNIVLNIFRQIRVTIDNYLTKRAFVDEGSFSAFNGVILGWLQATKNIYDESTYNAFIGTVLPSNSVKVDMTGVTAAASTADDESYARIQAQKIATTIADLFSGLKKPSKLYNDLNFYRSYKASNLLVIWNSKHANEITKLDLPTIFHNESVVKDLIKEENIIHEDYFGTINASETAGGANIYSLIEQDVPETVPSTPAAPIHVFAGENIPAGYTAAAGTSYTKDTNVVCIITTKKLPPYMSAFQVGTSFFNCRALLENHYLTFGHNSLERFADKPFIKVSL